MADCVALQDGAGNRAASVDYPFTIAAQIVPPFSGPEG